jgi:uncharacterized protein YacL
VQATNAVVNVVDQVRDKTTGPILTAARGLVFGIVVAVIAGIVAILVLIAVLRVLNEFLPVWATYLIIGSVFTIVGAVVFRRRHIPDVL